MTNDKAAAINQATIVLEQATKVLNEARRILGKSSTRQKEAQRAWEKDKNNVAKKVAFDNAHAAYNRAVEVAIAAQMAVNAAEKTLNRLKG